jgi:hypothetical protein
MMNAKLSRDHIRRRILDNLNWGNLPYHVIEPLPPLVSPPPPPSIPASEPPKPPPQPRSAVKQFAKKLVTTIPFLGRVAIVLMMPLLLPLSMAGALAGRLQSVTRRIDHLIR